MPRSVAEIQADIDRVKAQIAYNQKYSQGFAQPSTKVGWNSYIINNDRGLLDQYQARENAWKQQQANIDLQRELASRNKEVAEEDKKEAARLQMQKLEIARDGIARSGGDTRQIDAEINYLRDKYSFSKPEAEPYDPRNNVNYKLAKYSQISKSNKLDEIDAARKEISNFDTPEAAKRLAELDDIYDTRVKYEDALKHEKELVAGWKGGELSDGLINLGYTTKLEGNYNRLINKNGDRVRKIKISNNTNNSDDGWPD